MSQILQDVTGTPAIATNYVTDDSSIAVPAANALNILSNDTSNNNNNGIETRGTGDTVTIYVTNRLTGTVTTVNATPTTVLTFPLGATPGTYYILGSLVAYNVTDATGGAYDYSAGVRATGVVGEELGSENKDVFEDLSMATADFDGTVSGNNYVITVTGLAGKTINWNAILTYRFIG